MAVPKDPILDHENAHAPKVLEAMYEWLQTQLTKVRSEASNNTRRHEDLISQQSDGFTLTNQAKNIAFTQRIGLQAAQDQAAANMQADIKSTGELAENLTRAARQAGATIPNFQKATGAANVAGDDEEVKKYKATLNQKEFVEAFQKDPQGFINKLQQEYIDYHVPAGTTMSTPNVGVKTASVGQTPVK